MAINNKPASAYAKPHTMSGGDVNVKDAITKKGNGMDELKVSVGGMFKSQMDEVKTSGIKIRGTGAATKGVMARGPMA
jgi:hypothetical protein